MQLANIITVLDQSCRTKCIWNLSHSTTACFQGLSKGMVNHSPALCLRPLRLSWGSRAVKITISKFGSGSNDALMPKGCCMMLRYPAYAMNIYERCLYFPTQVSKHQITFFFIIKAGLKQFLQKKNETSGNLIGKQAFCPGKQSQEIPRVSMPPYQFLSKRRFGFHRSTALPPLEQYLPPPAKLPD